jgi:hypothetical protein
VEVVSGPPEPPWPIGSETNSKRHGWTSFFEGRGREDCPFPPARRDLQAGYPEGWDAAKAKPAMSDAELAEFLGLTEDEAAIIIPKLTPERRAGFEHMASIYAEIQLWEASVGPKPAGVFLCGPKQIRRAGRDA